MEKNRDGNDKFIYSYSAKQQMEIEKIREKYLPKKENKLDELRKIDDSVTRKGTLISISFGILSPSWNNHRTHRTCGNRRNSH